MWTRWVWCTRFLSSRAGSTHDRILLVLPCRLAQTTTDRTSLRPRQVCWHNVTATHRYSHRLKFYTNFYTLENSFLGHVGPGKKISLQECDLLTSQQYRCLHHPPFCRYALKQGTKQKRYENVSRSLVRETWNYSHHIHGARFESYVHTYRASLFSLSDDGLIKFCCLIDTKFSSKESFQFLYFYPTPPFVWSFHSTVSSFNENDNKCGGAPSGAHIAKFFVNTLTPHRLHSVPYLSNLCLFLFTLNGPTTIRTYQVIVAYKCFLLRGYHSQWNDVRDFVSLCGVTLHLSFLIHSTTIQTWIVLIPDVNCLTGLNPLDRT